MTPVEALQAALAGEHAAVYVLGVVGARVSASDEPAMWDLVREAYTTHRDRRDQLVAMVRAAGETPVAAEVAYGLPNPAMSSAQLREAALETERRCTAVYADLVGNTASANRQWALEALEDSAVRQLAFGGGPEPFPGVSEL